MKTLCFVMVTVLPKSILFQGSGNTWVRFLIEGATGFYTSSIYRDKTLQAGGFLGELVDYEDGATIVTKTHHSSFGNDCVKKRREMVNKYEGRGVVIIRNPFEVSWLSGVE